MLVSRRLIVFGLQLFLVALSSCLAITIRYDFSISEELAASAWQYIGLSICIRATVLHLMGLNRGWWRFFSLADMMAIFRALLVSHVIIFVAAWLLQMNSFSASVFMIDLILSVLLLGGARMAVRLYREYESKPNGRRASDSRVIILGAGRGGVNLLRNLRNAASPPRVIGFLDDSLQKSGMRFLGIPVLGKLDALRDVVKTYNISEVYIAIPSATKAELKSIVQLCLSVEVKFKRVPSIAEIMRDDVSAHQLMEVKVEDLLGREPIQLDKSKTHQDLRGASVLVTGAGGSIGSELCRQILQFQPRELIAIERSEYNLFKAERELLNRFPNQKIHIVVADVTDRDGISKIFEKYKPDFVYHAAAHKHVCLMETAPREAIRNNVFGTEIVSEMAGYFGAKSFLMISTDKAVRPLSVMGLSKRLAELAVQNMQKKFEATKFVSVRFGNVLGSSGSVVEVFRSQLAANEPLTVTDPEATRFFMTTPEAVELVLHAGSHGLGGEIYMLDMGEPVRIVDLARKMIDLADPVGQRGYQIKFIGLRSGEKMAEELYWEGEHSVPSGVSKVFRLSSAGNIRMIGDHLMQIRSVMAMGSDGDISQVLRSTVSDLDKAILASKSQYSIVEESRDDFSVAASV